MIAHWLAEGYARPTKQSHTDWRIQHFLVGEYGFTGWKSALIQWLRASHPRERDLSISPNLARMPRSKLRGDSLKVPGHLCEFTRLPFLLVTTGSPGPVGEALLYIPLRRLMLCYLLTTLLPRQRYLMRYHVLCGNSQNWRHRWLVSLFSLSPTPRQSGCQ